MLYWTGKENMNYDRLECGPMPNVMVAPPNIGGALCSCRKVWLMLPTWLLCSNAAKMRKPLKVAGVPQTNERSQPLVGRSSPYCGDIWRRYCCLTSFFPIVDTCLSCEDIALQSCTMVRRWRFFCVLQHVSDLHPKFALRPHHVWKYGRHPISDRWD